MILPRDFAAIILPRVYSSSCSSYNSRTGRCNTAWDRFGRWIVAGVLVLIAILLVLFLACLRSRRRRRTHPPTARMQPVGGYNQGYTNQNPNGYGGPHQQYASPPGAPPNDYYGQQSGVAQPGNVYQSGGYK